MFNDSDHKQIADRGSSLGDIEKQIENFKTGFPFLDIQKAATIGDGIIQLPSEQIDILKANYEQKIAGKSILKFVPASGAATRMFKDLFAYVDNPDLTSNKSASTFVEGLKKFAFYKELKGKFGNNGSSIESQITKGKYDVIADKLLSEEGLGYGSLPKALLSFHKYDENSRTPFEEHLVEGALYAKNETGQVNLHFTVSPEHQPKFELLFSQVKTQYEKTYGVSYSVTFSQQKSSTDTIAVDDKNEPFREPDGSILFRPAGHGALLENLNDLDADIIFIKNIDNVVTDDLKGDTINYKKALASLLIDCQEEIHGILKNEISDPDTVALRLKQKYFIEMSVGFEKLTKVEKVEALKSKLNKPIRVCGMVKNTGEPGGGPFWIKEKDGSFTLQIAETAQIDMGDSLKADMLKNSTHFNPVDLVCATKDFEGNSFDLLKYRDDTTGFISEKSKNGNDLKAMELPGLWNGAMADWITFFIEVPISTFNPVKTVNDLLKEAHQ
ncbi:DUF4301 family protein [Reichenbachiella versicolor]|uniref:DUF4301 family protein n=1 Tax=Reichenbachiella versicolor TaxID=1821036 RepID=UPI000D6E16F7|nr:DUF4301 family protein [Reichenbachiella versicolor]